MHTHASGVTEFFDSNYLQHTPTAELTISFPKTNKRSSERRRRPCICHGQIRQGREPQGGWGTAFPEKGGPGLSEEMVTEQPKGVCVLIA